MSTLVTARRSTVRRIIAGVCAVGLAFGATACQQDAEEPLIHAQHDKGAKLGGRIGDLESGKQIDDMVDVYLKWGAEQSPDWLKICNSINRKSLRKLGFDPQADLQNRNAKPDQVNQCVWISDETEQTVSIAKGYDSVKEADSRGNFELEKVVRVNDREIHVGHIKFRRKQKSTCTTNFESVGAVYTVTYFNDAPEVNKHDACEVAIDLSSGNQ